MRYKMNSLIVGLLLIGAVETQAVEYKNTYKGSDHAIQQTEHKVANSATTAPSASFQSTSAMPVASMGASTLNADGTVNAEAYGIGQEETPAKAPSGPRKVGGGQTIEGPVGDAVLPLLLMAMLFAGVVYTRRKRC
ncbi:MAG: hypothetical protein IJQ32_02625 [Paludibacteraceae bacterium]|nr:hypothetical protein [Paludibacteraceae bacterium]